MRTLVLTQATTVRVPTELARCASPVIVTDLARAWAELRSRPCDLLLIDNLPWRHVRTLLQRLRLSHPSALPDPWIPVLVLGVAPESCRVDLLDVGADACLPPGCDDHEVAATIRALWRRRVNGRQSEAAHDLVVHRALGVAIKDGRQVPLTPPEFSLLERLMEARPGLVSGSDLRAQLGARHDIRSAQSVVFQLRTKLGRKAVGTVRGQGYRLAIAARWNDAAPWEAADGITHAAVAPGTAPAADASLSSASP